MKPRLEVEKELLMKMDKNHYIEFGNICSNMEHTQKAKIFAELEDEGYIVRDNLSGYYIERKLITKKRGKFIAPLKILISKTYKYLLILLGWILKSLYDEIVPIIIEYIKNAMK